MTMLNSVDAIDHAPCSIVLMLALMRHVAGEDYSVRLLEKMDTDMVPLQHAEVPNMNALERGSDLPRALSMLPRALSMLFI